MKNLIATILLSITGIMAYAQSPATATNSEVKWYTIQDAEKLIKQEPRPIFIDAYTDWCGWCKKMDKDTFTDPIISNILNTKYYPVKFNAEGKENITVFGQTFINDGKAGNAHQLAVALLNGQLSYPTVVFLVPGADGKLQAQAVPGYRPAKDMEVLLGYISEGAYSSKTLDDYQKSFVGKVK